jgi:hypothetical protein
MKKVIKKSELKRIYDIACTTWQPKIEKYAQRNPFSEEVEFSEKEIKEMISVSTAEQLPTVKEVFNVVDSWQSIKSLQCAIQSLGDKDEEVITLRNMQNVNLPRYILAEQELVVVTKTVNEGWVADYNNHNQAKWYSWFYLGDNFRLADSVYRFSSSSVSSRLVLETEEKAKHLSDNFLNLYKEYMNK